MFTSLLYLRKIPQEWAYQREIWINPSYVVMIKPALGGADRCWVTLMTVPNPIDLLCSADEFVKWLNNQQ